MCFITIYSRLQSEFCRYNPSLLTNYDTSGNYYNLMTESKHHVQEPKVVERQIRELLEEEVGFRFIVTQLILNLLLTLGGSARPLP